MKSLTLDEIKTLQKGDWVWIVDKQMNADLYGRFTHSSLCFGELMFYYDTAGYSMQMPEKDYGKTWFAYKNKEQAECAGEYLEVPCSLGTPLFELETYFNDKDKWRIEEGRCSMLQQKADRSWKVRFSYTGGSCHDVQLAAFGKTIFTDKKLAEQRLKELKGE